MKKIPWTAISIVLSLATGVISILDQHNTIKEEVAKALADKK